MRNTRPTSSRARVIICRIGQTHGLVCSNTMMFYLSCKWEPLALLRLEFVSAHCLSGLVTP